jgi:hypothetical protein
LSGSKKTAAAALKFNAESIDCGAGGGSEEEESKIHAPNHDIQTYE